MQHSRSRNGLLINLSMNNKYTILLLLLIAVLTMNFRCMREDIEQRPYEQSFQVPVDIYPLKKTYSLSDTIWIETDITGKSLFDTRSNQLILADTGQLHFEASFNRFVTDVTNPPNGFCDVITHRGVNTDRYLGYWSTGGFVNQYGCGLPTYKCRIGFKPLIRGTYYLILANNKLFESCTNKVRPYHAELSFRYKSPDLGLDVFNAMSKNDKGGNDGIRFYTEKINNREAFVFRVE